MLVFLKTLHFISLWAAGGLGVGGWVLQHVHKRNHVKYPHSGADILKAQQEAREALYACGWWQQGDED